MFPSLWWVNPVFDVLFIFLLAASRRRSVADRADLLRSYLRHALLKLLLFLFSSLFPPYFIIAAVLQTSESTG
jgi:hypothetical protein